MAISKLDPEEKKILESVENGEWESLRDIGRERFQNYRQAAFRKDRRINIRISSRDLHSLQQRALEEGIPYQTLISGLLYKYD